jgi:AcrR family transcriptional regulator
MSGSTVKPPAPARVKPRTTTRGAPRQVADAPPRRRSQAERSESTRERLIEATVQLLRKRGLGGLRTAEVSQLAGVSRGAQLHHFPNKNALVIATINYLNSEMLAASRQRAQAARQGGDPIAQLIADAFDFFFGDYFFITLAIGMGDERNEELRQGVNPTMGPSRFDIERDWLAVLQAAGMPADLAADILALTLSLVRGFAVRTLIRDDRKRFAELMRLWQQIVGGYIASRMALANPPPKTGGRPAALPAATVRRAPSRAKAR